MFSESVSREGLLPFRILFSLHWWDALGVVLASLGISAGGYTPRLDHTPLPNLRTQRLTYMVGHGLTPLQQSCGVSAQAFLLFKALNSECFQGDC
jgi:hypothetical protein